MKISASTPRLFPLPDFCQEALFHDESDGLRGLFQGVDAACPSVEPDLLNWSEAYYAA